MFIEFEQGKDGSSLRKILLKLEPLIADLFARINTRFASSDGKVFYSVLGELGESLSSGSFSLRNNTEDKRDNQLAYQKYLFNLIYHLLTTFPQILIQHTNFETAWFSSCIESLYDDLEGEKLSESNKITRLYNTLEVILNDLISILIIDINISSKLNLSLANIDNLHSFMQIVNHHKEKLNSLLYPINYTEFEKLAEEAKARYSADLETKAIAVPNRLGFIWFGTKIPQNYLLNILQAALAAPQEKIILYADHPASMWRQLYSIPWLTPGAIPKNLEIISTAEILNRKVLSERGIEPKMAFHYLLCIARELIGWRNFAAASDMMRMLLKGIYADTDLIFAEKLSFPATIPYPMMYINSPRIQELKLFAKNNNCLLIITDEYKVQPYVEAVNRQYLPECAQDMRSDKANSFGASHRMLPKYEQERYDFTLAVTGPRAVQKTCAEDPPPAIVSLPSEDGVKTVYPIEGVTIKCDRTWTKPQGAKYAFDDIALPPPGLSFKP